MTLSEFVERTGFEPMPAEYAKIEEAYCNFNGDKDAFCKAFVEGGGEKKIYQARAAEIDRLNGKILEMDKSAKKDGEEYERRLTKLEAQLKEQQPEETTLWEIRRYVDSVKVQNTIQALPTTKELLALGQFAGDGLYDAILLAFAYGRAKGWQAAKGGAAHG